MHVALDSMATALGIRPNSLRIKLGIVTRLQGQVRAAKTFLDMVALEPEFREKMHSSCGPKFEPEELHEYKARRGEFFSDYLGQFNTIEQFKSFGKIAAGPSLSFFYNDEWSTASSKLYSLIKEMLESANDLTALIEVHQVVEYFHKYFKIYDQGFAQDLKYKMIRYFIEALRSTKSLKDRLKIIKTMPISYYDLFGFDHHRQEKSSAQWKFVWEEIESLEDAFLVEQTKTGDFISSDGLKVRMTTLLDKRMGRMRGFRQRLAFANSLAKRDNNGPDYLHSRSLELVAEKASTLMQVREIIKIWRSRPKNSSGSGPHISWPELPQIMLDKWDDLKLYIAEESVDANTLAELLESSPFGTKTRQVALDKLNNHFKLMMDTAQTEEELDQVEKDAKSLSGCISTSKYERRDAIRAKENQRRAEAVLSKTTRGEHPDPKKALIGLYHHYKESEPEQANRILRMLVSYFPAEAVEEVPVAQ